MRRKSLMIEQFEEYWAMRDMVRSMFSAGPPVRYSLEELKRLVERMRQANELANEYEYADAEAIELFDETIAGAAAFDRFWQELISRLHMEYPGQSSNTDVQKRLKAYVDILFGPVEDLGLHLNNPVSLTMTEWRIAREKAAMRTRQPS